MKAVHKETDTSLVQAISVSLVLIPDINILQPFSGCDDVDKHDYRREKDELMFLFYFESDFLFIQGLKP
ncbi:hypothetical protein [Paenibacillus sp. FSL K6-1230]|uniref:hypothetical protein n=1 Tax=Paenibacillus sp. FSL K6-1230 TaxID=2921603 RepID=UPI0030F5AB9F